MPFGVWRPKEPCIRWGPDPPREEAIRGGGDAAVATCFVGISVQTLQFLVRDWSHPYVYPYGAIGGQMLLEHRIQVRETVAHML